MRSSARYRLVDPGLRSVLALVLAALLALIFMSATADAHIDEGLVAQHGLPTVEDPTAPLETSGDSHEGIEHPALGGHCHPSLECSLVAALNYPPLTSRTMAISSVTYGAQTRLVHSVHFGFDPPPPRSSM